MNHAYRPIDCSLHDELELRALRRTRCRLVYRDESGGELHASAALADLVTRGGEEFLRLADGTEIRLDRIVSIDGLRFCP